MSPARVAAYRVLRKVSQGGYAVDLMLREGANLESRDARLAAQIVMGCLRRRGQLNFLIELYSGRPQPALDEDVRLAMHMGIFQIRYLDRVPIHAAVTESVELVKHGHKRSAGFVNAVLRKVKRSPVTWPDRATELSIPEWMLERWDAQFGSRGAEGIARAALQEPETYVRVPRGTALEEMEPGRFRSAHGAELASTEVEGAFRLLSGDQGPFRIQDIGSQAIVPLLDLHPETRLLDLCAAPGNKTAQALESGAACVACDRSRARLSELTELGVPLVVLDAADRLPFATQFDRVLVDAPCSGTGTLSRNPEIKWRIEPEDVFEQSVRQKRILANALLAVKPEGRVVYATCSLEREENQDVVEAVLASHPDFRIAETLERIPGRDAGDGFYAAVLVRK